MKIHPWRSVKAVIGISLLTGASFADNEPTQRANEIELPPCGILVGDMKPEYAKRMTENRHYIGYDFGEIFSFSVGGKTQTVTLKPHELWRGNVMSF